MEKSTTINKNVNIIAYYFKGQGPKCFPKRMEFDGKQVIFTETGLRHRALKGQRMVHLFDMTDGQTDYRLEFDAEELNWKLLYMAGLRTVAVVQ